MGKFPKDTASAVRGLLCPDTLRLAMRTSSNVPVASREEIKELLPQNIESSQEASAEDFSRWERCLDLLVEEFLLRKLEILKLNKARRDQIEEFIRTETKLNLNLNDILHARLGSEAHSALMLFANLLCIFNFLQVLLVKRWADKGLIEKESFLSGKQTLNWIITDFIKKRSAKGLVEKDDWAFIKANLFSWFMPSKESWERLKLLLEPANLSLEAEDLPARMLCSFQRSRNLSISGVASDGLGSENLWQILFEQRASDLKLNPSEKFCLFPETQGPVLVSGLKNGESLSALRNISGQPSAAFTWAFTDDQFERFLSEIGLLWNSDAGNPRINLHSRALLKQISKDAIKSSSLFQNPSRLPYQAQFAASFAQNDGRELEDASFFLDQVKEHGLILLSSQNFWPTDSDPNAEKMRDAILKKASIRLILDLRQLSGLGAAPKGIYILEKCSNKEMRDSNRPQILRLKGQLQAESIGTVWKTLLEQVRVGSPPGEVISKSFPTLSESFRLEAMGAAANQQELRSAPWITLSDPAFYEASARLKKLPNRSFTFGTIMRWKEGIADLPRKSIVLQEKPKFLHASLPEFNSPTCNEGESAKFFFLPENGVAEEPAFFTAQVLSAPVQFWHRLELEQSIGKSTKQTDRQSEQRLKLMPLIRIFEQGSLLATHSDRKPLFASLDEAKKILQSIFRQPTLGMADRVKLHQIVVDLENTIRVNLTNCIDLSKHLFPDLEINRWQIPQKLLQPSVTHVMEIFQHLDQSALSAHPSIHIARLRSAHDFKVSNSQYDELPKGSLAELKIFHGGDVVLKLSGPALLLRAAHLDIQKRVGRPWREISERLRYPTDITLVQTMLKDILKSIESHLANTRDQVACMDQIFCCLFGLATNFSDDSVRQAIRRHLSPEESKFDLVLPKEEFKSAIAEGPMRILQ